MITVMSCYVDASAQLHRHDRMVDTTSKEACMHVKGINSRPRGLLAYSSVHAV